MNRYVCIILLIMSTSSAFAESLTARQLMEACIDEDLANRSYCAGYVEASFETGKVLMEQQGKPLCIPKDLKVQDVTNLFIKLIVRLPEFLDSSAYAIVGAALTYEYECNKEKE